MKNKSSTIFFKKISISALFNIIWISFVPIFSVHYLQSRPTFINYHFYATLVDQALSKCSNGFRVCTRSKI